MHARAASACDLALADTIEKAAQRSVASGLNENHDLNGDLVRLFGESVYRATELFDTYTQHIPTALGIKDDRAVRKRLSPFVDAAKQRRSPWANLCNKLKHNHYVLTPHRCRYSRTGRTVEGYRVSKHDEQNVLRAAPEFHVHARSISFGVALRELLHDILRTDSTAAKMLGVVTSAGGSAFMPKSLAAIGSLPDWPNIYESGQRNTVVQVEGGWALSKNLLVAVQEDSVQSTVTTADGFTNSFELP